MYLSQSEIKYLRSLQQKKYRDIESKFLLEGWYQLKDALQSEFKIELIAVLTSVSKKTEQSQLIELAKGRGIIVKELKEVQLKQISDTVHSQGVVAIVHQQKNVFDINILKTKNLIVACDGVNDPGNLGTILRTCDWFDVDAVLLNESCVSIYNEKVIRSTAGSIFHIKVFEKTNLLIGLSHLKSIGFKLIAATLDGKPLSSFIPQEKAIIIFGSEAHGVNIELIKIADEALSIPRYGKAESLNVGIACGIFLAHWRNRANHKL